jgi:hypothetical protein
MHGVNDRYLCVVIRNYTGMPAEEFLTVLLPSTVAVQERSLAINYEMETSG